MKLLNRAAGLARIRIVTFNRQSLINVSISIASEKSSIYFKE